MLAVTDACGGIPEDDLARVFDVAFRGNAARTPPTTPAAGSAWPSCAGIVEAHRGAVAVHNVDGGCRFELRIPATVA